MVCKNCKQRGRDFETRLSSSGLPEAKKASFETLKNLSEISSWRNPFLGDWDWRFIRIAQEVSSWSKDPKRKVGCVLVVGKRDISKGYNGLPVGLSDTLERLTQPSFKDRVIIHAEVNAILNAAKFGVSTEGATAYITRHPCSNCASHLIQAGITKVICPSPDFSSEKWSESFKVASDIMLEAGLLTLYYCNSDGT